MGWGNPAVPWSEMEARLSGRLLPGADGNDGPALGRRRRTYAAPTVVRAEDAVPYAELHAHSNYSFLDGVSHPEELVAEAARLGIETLALTDHDGLYGIVRFTEAAREAGIGTVIGAELSLGLSGPQNGAADPEGDHLVVLARDSSAYGSLSATIADAQLAGHKGAPRYEGGIEALGERSAGGWMVLTGCRKGAVRRALDDTPRAARRELQRLVAAFGRDNVAVELTDHADPYDSHRNDVLVELAAQEAVRVVVTNNVHYARPSDHRLATVVAAIRARASLDELDGWLPASPGQHLRSGVEQTRRFRRYPAVVAATATLGRELAFDLKLVAPDLPGYDDLPAHTTPMVHLRALVEQRGRERYGPRDNETVEGAWRQVDHELAVIAQLNYPGYFLIVHDIVRFCHDNDILCQGRGSAANSAVCYVLGITNADAVKLGLLFERFLAPERDGPPDIDLDIESGRREEVIQYVYEHYGRRNAAQVANVITYRPRSAIRDVGKALGHSQGQVDAWSRQVSSWGRLLRPPEVPQPDQPATDGDDPTEGIPDQVLQLADRLVGAPRHLGIHSGGMVLCDRPIVEVCPIEHARMDNRTVLQWDKDDCATAGLVKFDLLGLGMLSALHDTLDLLADHHDRDLTLATIPTEDPAVYDMLCTADAIGVFQVESRAQLSTLPRLKPRKFYDLVVEVALIRPGPIQGGSVHPYLRRRAGTEPVTYLHPLLEPVLERTLGVPLFQEQLMQMAVAVGGFTAAEADQLRQAMGSKRSTERMNRLRGRLYDGMARRGITGEVADRIYTQIAAFADFGFPESHSVSFAHLVYASAWLKRYYPAAFLTGLLNNQPMGFYSPQSLVADARRQGVVVHRADINTSLADARLVPDPDSTGGVAVRLGLRSIRTVGDELAEAIADRHRPYTSMEDLVRRTGASHAALASLATAGALDSLGITRREALWAAGAAAWATADRIPATAPGTQAPTLPGMTAEETTTADLIATGVSPTSHPIEHLRGRLDSRVVPINRLHTLPHSKRVLVAGVVTHRQQPATASGVVFLNLEDETGMLNVICTPPVWARCRKIAITSSTLIVTGKLERTHGVTGLTATGMQPLSTTAPIASRDFC